MSDDYETTPDIGIVDNIGTGDPVIHCKMEITLDTHRESVELDYNTEGFDWTTASEFHITEEFDTLGALPGIDSCSAVVEYDPDVGGVEGFSATDWDIEYT